MNLNYNPCKIKFSSSRERVGVGGGVEKSGRKRLCVEGGQRGGEGREEIRRGSKQGREGWRGGGWGVIGGNIELRTKERERMGVGVRGMGGGGGEG